MATEATSSIEIPVTPELFIGGRWRAAADRFEVHNPATEAPLAAVADARAADGVAAVDAASAALASWAARAPRERAEVLRRSFELLIERREPLARIVTLENGKPLEESRSEVTYAAEFFRWFSEEAVRLRGELSIAPSGANRIIVQHRPVGVSYLITPWNFPAAMAARKVAPALAAGCTVVLKPAALTPLTALAVASVLQEAGVPAGVLNVVPSTDARGLTAAVLGDRRVRKLSFTGSTPVGKTLLAQAAARVVNCSMELGGNAPFIVLADADLDAATEGALVAKMRHNAQTCTAANRFYVEAPVASEFAARLADRMGALRMGNGLEEGVQVGPLVDAAARENVDRMVRAALAAGARPVLGGAPASGKGFFYPPTVLDGVDAASPILAEEIFGPVAPIVAVSGAEEAVARANDTDMGLVAYLYTGNLAAGLALSERLEFGMVGLNRGVVSDPAAPFGGVKESGIGREGAQVGLHEYTELTYIATAW